LLVSDRAVRPQIPKAVGRQADIADRFANPFHEIADRDRVQDDAGPAPLQRIRTTFQNVYVPALVSENQGCGESAEGPPDHNGPRHVALSPVRTLGANAGGGTAAMPPRIAVLAAVVVGAGRN
jgi:hypothetical protein